MELVNDGLVQLALIVLLARIRAYQDTSSQYVATALLETMVPQLVCKLLPAQALVRLARTLLLELPRAPQ